MKITLNILILITCISCNKKIEYQNIKTRFIESSNIIDKVEYKIQRIDSFASGDVWNNTGFALIEKDSNDPVFGFSFYGKRDDVSDDYIYDKGVGFEINNKNKTYKANKESYGFIGSPGGQMIVQDIFYLDTIYQSVIISETKNSYVLSYKFVNDTIYNISNISKTVELNKSDLFPVKTIRKSRQLDKNSVHQVVLSAVKINKEVTSLISNYKNELKNYKLIKPKQQQVSKLLLKKAPEINLSNLFVQDNVVNIKANKLTLIDFWEVWCEPCIASLSKIERLQNKFKENLQVVGIVSEDTKIAIKLLEKKHITFLNLIGNDSVKNAFNINSWPRYFLINKKGIIENEYFGFSEQIEKDIDKFINK